MKATASRPCPFWGVFYLLMCVVVYMKSDETHMKHRELHLIGQALAASGVDVSPLVDIRGGNLFQRGELVFKIQG